MINVRKKFASSTRRTSIVVACTVVILAVSMDNDVDNEWVDTLTLWEACPVYETWEHAKLYYLSLGSYDLYWYVTLKSRCQFSITLAWQLPPTSNGRKFKRCFSKKFSWKNMDACLEWISSSVLGKCVFSVTWIFKKSCSFLT